MVWAINIQAKLPPLHRRLIGTLTHQPSAEEYHAKSYQREANRLQYCSDMFVGQQSSFDDFD